MGIIVFLLGIGLVALRAVEQATPAANPKMPIAGAGVPGYTGDGGLASRPCLGTCLVVAVDAQGNVLDPYGLSADERDLLAILSS